MGTEDLDNIFWWAEPLKIDTEEGLPSGQTPKR
jgi:hypothetical protein